MQVVVVSSPGHGRRSTQTAHWSHAHAARIVAEVHRRGGEAWWLAGVGDAAHVGEWASGDVCPDLFATRANRCSSIAANSRDPALEAALTARLRTHPLASVVHVGVGAGGTPNVLWLAERLGSRVVACARGAELVCPRGDLVDRDGRACEVFDDPERCRWCCASGWWRKPHVSEIQNRTDLVIAGLLASEAVLVAEAGDVAAATELGVPAARVEVGIEPANVVERLEHAPA